MMARRRMGIVPIPSNLDNINHPTLLEELPDELRQQVEAKFNAILKAFLESCTKDW
jgi:hypothetical protein